MNRTMKRNAALATVGEMAMADVLTDEQQQQLAESIRDVQAARFGYVLITIENGHVNLLGAMPLCKFVHVVQ